MIQTAGWLKWTRSHTGIVFVLWSLWLAAPYLCAGSWSYVKIADCADSIISQDMAVAAEMRKGTVNYWAPFQICGSDGFASCRFPFKIDVLLFAALPAWLAHGLLMWLQRYLAGYFTYLLLRKVLQTDYRSAMFSGLAYAAVGQGFTLYDLLVLPGTPLLIWFLARQDPGRFRSFVLSALMGALTALCSNIQFALFLVPLVLFWFLVIDRKKSLQFWAMAATLGCAYVVTESPVLLALYMNSPGSHRTDFQFMTDGFSSPSGIAVRACAMRILVLAWDNALALVMVAASLMLSRAEPSSGRPVPASDSMAGSVRPALGSPALQDRVSHRRLKWMLAAGLVFAAWPMLLLLAGLAKPVFPSWPGFVRGFDFSRLMLFVPFLLIVSAGLSLHAVGEKWRLVLESDNCRIFGVDVRKMLIGAAVAVLVVQSLLMHSSVLMEAVKGSNYHAFYRNSNVRRLAEKVGTEDLFRVATVALHHSGAPQPGFAWTYGLESADGYVVHYSRRYKEFWAKVLQPSLSRDPLLASFFLSWGSKAYLFSPFFFAGADSRHFHTELAFGEFFNLKLLSMTNVKYVISPMVLKDENLSLIFSPTQEEIAWQDNPGRFVKLMPYITRSAPDFPIYVYENLRVVPRFRLVGHLRLFDDARDVPAAMELSDQAELLSSAFLERDAVRDIPMNSVRGSGGKVEVRSYAWDRIVISAACETPSLLIVANSWSPYWKASLDGVESRIFPANHAFQGLYCPAGNHEIILRYMPPYRLH